MAAITSLKEQVEGLQDLDKSAEILTRLLCVMPGWTEKNVQVIRSLAFVVLKASSPFLFLLSAKNIKACNLSNAGSATGY